MNSQFGMGHKCESDFPKRGGVINACVKTRFGVQLWDKQLPIAAVLNLWRIILNILRLAPSIGKKTINPHLSFKELCHKLVQALRS